LVEVDMEGDVGEGSRWFFEGRRTAVVLAAVAAGPTLLDSVAAEGVILDVTLLSSGEVDLSVTVLEALLLSSGERDLGADILLFVVSFAASSTSLRSLLRFLGEAGAPSTLGTVAAADELALVLPFLTLSCFNCSTVLSEDFLAAMSLTFTAIFDESLSLLATTCLSFALLEAGMGAAEA
jgi:hypothetical protein